nr:MAG TPA: hypothetical protein [Caudoviricetes sp.]
MFLFLVILKICYFQLYIYLVSNISSKLLLFTF